jgi:hypothetical protein
VPLPSGTVSQAALFGRPLPLSSHHYSFSTARTMFKQSPSSPNATDDTLDRFKVLSYVTTPCPGCLPTTHNITTYVSLIPTI